MLVPGSVVSCPASSDDLAPVCGVLALVEGDFEEPFAASECLQTKLWNLHSHAFRSAETK